jgi:carbon-monoxide dehydrogenase medium subunit
VKSAPFQYHAPSTADEAIALLSEHGDDAKVLAGGQSLLPLLALRLARPSVLVDVGRVAELRGIDANGSLRVGAMTTQRIAERSDAVREHCPLLHRALPLIAHRAIRTRGTIGGSLAHADPAAELPAVALALDADLVVRGPSGERTVGAAGFFEGYLTTTLAADELLVEIRIPPMAAGSTSTFVEISRRHGDFALAGCAAAVAFGSDGTIADARLAFTGVDAVPVRATAAEALLRGNPPGDDLFADAGAAVSAAVEPSNDIHATGAYRKHIAGVLTRRALTEMAATRGGQR